MKITTKTRYGIRALIYVGEKTWGKKDLIRIKEISDKENISVQYLEQILNKLKKAEIIEGKRGPNGGYRLIQSPDSINMYNLFKILESKIELVQCDKSSKSCTGDECRTFYLWKKLNMEIEKILKNTSLKELMDNSEKGDFFK